MKREEIKQIFYEFLVQEGVLFNFLSYTTIDYAFVVIEKFHRIAKYTWQVPRDLIYAIPSENKNWYDAIEGYAFWENVSDKWETKCKELNI